MEKFIYDENNGLWYELQGDYYIPCLAVPEGEQPIGLLGQRHLRYIREHKKAFYTSQLLSGSLNSYLVEVDKRAAEMIDRLIREMAAREGITEKMKAENQMEWVRRMNAIRNAAQEIVNAEVIFV